MQGFHDYLDHLQAPNSAKVYEGLIAALLIKREEKEEDLAVKQIKEAVKKEKGAVKEQSIKEEEVAAEDLATLAIAL